MRVLFLDDDEVRHKLVLRYTDRCVHVTTAKEANEKLSAERFDLVFLDHDLSRDHYSSTQDHTGTGTGFDVAKHLAALPQALHPDHVIVHSMHPVGAERMRCALQGAGIRVSLMMFGSSGFLGTLRQVRDFRAA